jgi:CRISPR-associated endonuclease/helicase Cas3
MEMAEFHRWAVYLLVLHDIGKFAVTFQALRPDLLKLLQQRATDKVSKERHDTLGYLLWQEKIKPHLQQDGVLPAATNRRSQPAVIQSADVWMAAMTGHHGTPPKTTNGLLLSDPFEITDQESVTDFVSDVSSLLLPGHSSFPSVDPETMRQASWWLAGFAVLCDWLGSNRTFFPYQDRPQTLDTYWKQACQQAEAAVADTGLLPKTVTRSLQLDHLIGNTKSIVPTPLQKLASQLELDPGPQLFILEDVTGAGKTEAALLIAQRLMAGEHAHGLYFGLPTMATANAMYERLGKQGYRQLYQSDQQPSLVLAHGAAYLLDDFRNSLVAGTVQSDGGYEGLLAAAAHCNQWLADNRKKALLADMGIGTLDQALLAILPSKHQSLRLLGLVGKVLVIDEVHACDTYMHTLLCRLLRAHAAAGGSAILLSATLPYAQRQALANSFAKGLGMDKQALGVRDYPLLTQVSTRPPREVVVPTRESVRRQVRVDCLESEEAVEAVIAEALQNNQCLCWIRNTVADARETYTRLRDSHPDWNVDLFHARFAMADRLDIERRVLDSFGRNSRQGQRSGRLLIATQVVEQSLDLDFDLLITDLAPIDLIIQRAGRLRRHARDVQGNPIEGQDQRGMPVLRLFTPVWQEQPDDNWFASANCFRRAAYVYPDHGQLWLGLKLLRERGGFRMPEDARSLIEGVYGGDAAIPEGLQSRTFAAQGGDKARQSVAMLNELKIELGYNDGATNRWWDDTKTPTRLGDPTTTVWLARWEDGQLKPWRNSLPFHWQQSSLSLRSDWIAGSVATDDIPQEAIDACMEELPAKGKWGVILPLQLLPNGAWEGRATNGKGEISLFRYSPIHGLIIGKEIRAMEDVAE